MTEKTLDKRPGKDPIRDKIKKFLAEKGGGLPALPDEIPGTTITATNGPERLPAPDHDEDLDNLTPQQRFNRHKALFVAGGLPRIEDTMDFLRMDVAKPKVLVKGLLHQGSKMIIGSGSKSYKTWALLDLAISVACGVPWLGLETTKGKVLFANFELKPASIKSRIEAIQQAKGVQWDLGCFDLWNLRGYAADYDKIIPAILEKVKSRGYDLIVLDPIYKLYGDTDENSAGDVAKLLNALEKLAVQSQAAVVFSAHYSKGNQAGKESVDRVSGSGVFARDPDTILSLTKHEQENAFVVESTLRDFEQMKPFVVQWEYPLLVRAEKLNPDKLKTNNTRKAKYTVDALLAPIAIEPHTTKELKEAVMEETGIGDTVFYELLKKLEDVEGVKFKPSGKVWSYTPPTNEQA